MATNNSSRLLVITISLLSITVGTLILGIGYQGTEQARKKGFEEGAKQALLEKSEAGSYLDRNYRPGLPLQFEIISGTGEELPRLTGEFLSRGVRGAGPRINVVKMIHKSNPDGSESVLYLYQETAPTTAAVNP